MGRKKLIRKQPLLDKIRSYPFDLLLAINEQRLSIDWEDYIPQTLPGGCIASIVFLILSKLSTHYKMAASKRDNLMFRTDSAAYEQVVARAIQGSKWEPATPLGMTSSSHSSTFLFILDLLQIVLFAISCFNALHVYLYPFRDYSLLSQSAKLPKPKGSNVFKQNISTGRQGGFISSLLSYFSDTSYYETDVESDGEPDTTYDTQTIEKDVWVLRVWDPSHFLIYLSSTFSPVTLFVLWLFTTSASIWKIIVFVILFNSSSFYLISRLFRLQSDKQIVFSETFNEYNKKYVIPKTNVLRKNAIVDATLGPFAAVGDSVHDDQQGHLQNELAFITHDITGKRIKSVRGDRLLQPPSRVPSPAKSVYSNIPSSLRSTRIDHSVDKDYYSRSRHHDNVDGDNLMMLSTPFSRRMSIGDNVHQRNDPYAYANNTFPRGYDGRYDSFSRTSSRAPSPMKSPSRLYNANISYGHRTQLSPQRSSRQLSPQRSPSPSKRPWL